MRRKGTYTKQPSPFRQSKGFFRRKWHDFRGLSKRKKAVLIGTPILAFLILTPVITYLSLARDISNPERLMNRNNTGVRLLDSKGKVFFSSGSSKKLKRVPLSQISDYAEKAAVSSEDKNFYKNSGISFSGILAAFYGNLTHQSLTAYGGSTITQQLVKNTLLTNQKTYFRKYQEVALAVAIDKQYSKDQILDFYLNSVYYGEGAFGIDEAAQTYFNIPASKLDLAQSAELIGILPAPSAYSPISGDRTKAKQKQARVLRRMQEDGKITAAQKTQATQEKLSFAAAKPEPINNAPHFTQMVLDELNKKYGEEKVKRSGYQVKTSLNLKWQKQAEQNVKDQTAINAQVGGRNAALVAIDPKTGGVRALVGSSDYNNPKFGKVNAATTPRQPGSSFKPIYYAEAINQKKITAATVLHDKPMDFGGYKPNNFDFAFRGDITARDAISQSLNIPSVEVMQKLGVNQAVNEAQTMGISTIKDNKNYGLSLALGSVEVPPIEMVHAYAAFANQGDQYETHLIDSIDNKFSENIFSYKLKDKQVQSKQASFIISDILSDNQARAPTFGDRLTIPGKKVAVKTGSTDDDKDAWTIGYTPDVAVGVWVGNNEHEAMTGGGSFLAGPIWSRSITEFLNDVPNDSFHEPSGVVQRTVCSGPASGTKEYYVDGTQPSTDCGARQSAPPKKETPKPVKPTPTETKPQEQTDTDNDGVSDQRDQCPGTPSGTAVDKDGCAIPPPAPVDSDGDGVTDDNDKCPGTPSGVTVDQNGCSTTTPPVSPPSPTGQFLAPDSRRYS